MRVRVDKNLCTGHARCYSIDPELFELDDVGYSVVDSEEVPPGSEERARQAVLNCPEHAISLDD
jgi:ferredoxin